MVKNKNLISKQELARELGITTAKLSRFVNSGAVTPVIRLTRKTMFFDASVINSLRSVSDGK